MEVQEYILENKKDFNSTHIFECGQCFRWNRETDNSYIGVIKNSVLEVREENGKIIFMGVSDRDIKDVVWEYFNLNVDYSKIKSDLSNTLSKKNNSKR